MRGGHGPFSTGPFRHPRHGLAELSEAAGRKPAAISSMCAVFAETEIISCLRRVRHPPISPPASSAPSPGVCGALPPAYPCATNARSRAGWRKPFVQRLLSEELGVPVNVPSMLVGASGGLDCRASEQLHLHLEGELSWHTQVRTVRDITGAMCWRCNKPRSGKRSWASTIYSPLEIALAAGAISVSLCS
ncbi:MAG: hypothetical protein ACLRWP_05690 [Bilophila wadsworthia]